MWKEKVGHFHYKGPSRSRPARSLLFFKWQLFCSKWSHFSLPEHAPKLTKLGIYITPAQRFHNLLSSSISTTRRCYNQGKCVWLITHMYFVAHSKTLYPRVLHISTLVCPNDMKLRWLLPHEPLRLCEKMINLLFRTPPKPFHRFATNFASSISGQNLSKAFTYITPGGAVHFDASP